MGFGGPPKEECGWVWGAAVVVVDASSRWWTMVVVEEEVWWPYLSIYISCVYFYHRSIDVVETRVVTWAHREWGLGNFSLPRVVPTWFGLDRDSTYFRWTPPLGGPMVS